MKLVKKIAIILLVIFVILVIIGAYMYRSSGPEYDGDLYLKGISEKAEVYYDDFGVPHIYAGNQNDAYFLLGYAVAKERLFQADLMKRVGQGRLSEIFGKELIETDKLFRTLGIARHGDESLKSLDLDQRCYQLAEQYLEGFNEFIRTGDTPIEYSLLGIEKEEFELRDMFAISGYMAFSFSRGLKNDPLIHKLSSILDSAHLSQLNLEVNKDYLFNGIADLPYNPKETSELIEALPVAPFHGSNAWAVSPWKSKSGKALFSNDTHIKYSQPGTWYEAHLEYPGFSFYGNFLAGIPFALVGHTKKQTWGLTMLLNDDTDLFLEQVEKEKYFHNGNWKEFSVHDEKIEVKNASTESFTAFESVHGPIVNDLLAVKFEQPVSMYWTYLRFPNDLLEAFYELSYSNSIQETENAVSKISAPGLNVVYANEKGNIGIWAAAKLLNRKEGQHSKILLRGDGSQDLEEYHPFEVNPKQIDPECGYVYSANHAYDTINGYFHPGYYARDQRSSTINDFLKENDKLDLDKFKELIYTNTNKKHSELSKGLCEMIRKQTLEKQELNTLKLLEEWNGSYELGDPEPVIYVNFLHHLFEEVFLDEVGTEHFKDFKSLMVFKHSYPEILLDPNSIWWQNKEIDGTEDPDLMVSSAFRNAVENITKRLGVN
ncbi:MAG: penicillin acylase family protein, partial [Flavobacteriales bacterium]|nr:penicillin acylase family protein [Flavobacteriales bacterium]